MRTMSRGLAALVAVVAAATGTILVPSAAAEAATPEIVVSRDGVNFAPDMSTQLFDDLGKVVPGDAVSASLWLRNQSGTSALVRVAVDDLLISSPELATAMTLSSTLNGFTYASSLSSLSDCQVVVEAQTVPAGSTVRVDFEVLMSDATSGLTGQGENASLGFVVTAHEWAAGPFPDDNGCSTLAGGDPDDPDGGVPQLPFTGADVTTALAVAGGLIVLGALFAAARRRRRDDETQDHEHRNA